jgi:hypothetical protein
MSNPSIQNDFSYYRRTVSRMKSGMVILNLKKSKADAVVSDDLANKMSLFFAHATPFTKSLIDSLATSITTVCLFCCHSLYELF